MKSIEYYDLNCQMVKNEILKYADKIHINRHDTITLNFNNHDRTIHIDYLKSPRVYQFTVDAIINNTYISPALISQVKLPDDHIKPSVNPV